MTQMKLDNIWNYYMSLEGDFTNTSRFIEPINQEDVYSFEFAKLLILSCTEIESLLKLLCIELSGNKCGNMGEYKDVILSYFPKIVFAEVYIPRWAKTVLPFSGWDAGKLSWWDTYSDIKHDRSNNFKDATYKNAVYALAALYILILYLAQMKKIHINDSDSTYIISEYSSKYLVCSPSRQLPDFEQQNPPSSAGRVESVNTLFNQEEAPQSEHNGDIWIRCEK